MNLEDQVTSLELSKKLLNLGVKQESIFVWEYYDDQCHAVKFIPYAVVPNEMNKFKLYSAFTVAELGKILPDFVKADKLFNNGNTTLLDLSGHFIKSQKKDDEYKIYIDCLTKCTIFFSKNEANARAKMLIYLLENKLME